MLVHSPGFGPNWAPAFMSNLTWRHNKRFAPPMWPTEPVLGAFAFVVSQSERANTSQREDTFQTPSRYPPRRCREPSRAQICSARMFPRPREYSPSTSARLFGGVPGVVLKLPYQSAPKENP